MSPAIDSANLLLEGKPVRLEDSGTVLLNFREPDPFEQDPLPETEPLVDPVEPVYDYEDQFVTEPETVSDLGKDAGVDTSTEPIVDQETINQAINQMTDDYETQFVTEPETRDDGYQGLPKNNQQNIVGEGTSATEPDPSTPEEIREEWASGTEPNMPASIDYNHLQDIDYDGNDPEVAAIIEGLEAGFHSSASDQEEHVTMKNSAGVVGHHYPHKDGRTDYEVQESPNMMNRKEDPRNCSTVAEMVKHHDLDWEEAVELKSQYRWPVSEPMPQTDPKACTTAAQLCLHHDWDPASAKLGIKQMKMGLGTPYVTDIIDFDYDQNE